MLALNVFTSSNSNAKHPNPGGPPTFRNFSLSLWFQILATATVYDRFRQSAVAGTMSEFASVDHKAFRNSACRFYAIAASTLSCTRKISLDQANSVIQTNATRS